MIATILIYAIRAYILILFLYAITTWFPQLRNSGFALILKAVTEPVLKPIQKLLGPVQGGSAVDFSPIALIVILSLLQRLVWMIFA